MWCATRSKQQVPQMHDIDPCCRPKKKSPVPKSTTHTPATHTLSQDTWVEWPTLDVRSLIPDEFRQKYTGSILYYEVTTVQPGGVRVEHLDQSYQWPPSASPYWGRIRPHHSESLVHCLLMCTHALQTVCKTQSSFNIAPSARPA